MASSPPITHIVLFKYRPDLSWSTLESYFQDFQSLRTKCLHPQTSKPYMLSMRMGKNTSWESFHKGMTHGFILEFANQSDLDHYLTCDPIHLAFSRAAKQLIGDSIVIDILDGQLFGPRAVKPGTPEAGGVYPGSCHCGSLAWKGRFTEEPKHILCHCDTCKQLGGGPYSCNFIVPAEDLAMIKGEPKHYSWKGASGKEVHCYFCGSCGSHVYHRQDVMYDKVIVRTLLLDRGKELRAGGEIFQEGKLDLAQDLAGNLTATPGG